MEQYHVTGMSCAACSARVEKAVRAVPGVSDCSVSLLTNSMGVEGNADPASIIAAVTGAGYGASRKTSGGEAAYLASQDADALADRETPQLKKRLLWSLGFLLALMYVSMGHMMWGFPLPKWFDGNHVAVGLVQLLLAAAVIIINQRFFQSGFQALRHRAPNMDTLVALGSAASFVWSVYALFCMTRAQADGDMAAVERSMMEFYFESAAMILTLITVGKLLEARSKGRTTDALKGLMKLAPQTAVILRDGAEVTVPVAQVKKDDIFIVRPGEAVPVDGVVVAGSSAVNEAALTGESIPVDKAEGDVLSAATVNQSGYLKARATRVGEDTTLRQIIKMVSDAAATKAPIAKAADKVSGIFVPAVISISVIVTVIWLLVGREFSYALARGISVLVISCPCALGLATPVAIMVGNGVGAKNGILFKTAVSLEQTGKAKLVALDKTGTITTGEPAVTDLLPAENVSETELLTAALALEQRSEHPLAGAIVARAEAFGLTAPVVTDFRALPGNGLEAMLNGEPLVGGSMNYITQRLSRNGSAHTAQGSPAVESRTGSTFADLVEKAETFAAQGKTPLLFAHGGRLLGVIAVADVIKPESPAAVQELRDMGMKVIMLTGDNERTARAIAAQAGVDEVVAGVLPEGKEAAIRELQRRGPVLMVGDGINDAPALTRADIGIAIGAGTDVAIDAADVVLMKSRLSDVPAAVRLSRATLRNIHQNLFWAFLYNTVGIPLAAGAFIRAFGWTLNPMFGAAAMSLSSFCVVTNALRLNLVKLHPDTPKAAADNSRAGSAPAPLQSMEISVRGMMCEHCERHVKEALEALPGVESAEANHKTGIVRIQGNAAEADMKQAIRAAGYRYKKRVR